MEKLQPEGRSTLLRHITAALAVLSVLMLHSQVVAQTLKKVELTGAKPDPRIGHGLVNVDGKVYLFGGFRRDTPAGISPAGEIVPYGFFDDIWQFSKGAAQFERIDAAQMYEPVGFFGATAINKLVIALYGLPQRNDILIGWAYNPKTNSWSKLEKENGPKPRDAPSVVTRGDKIMFMGGLGKSSTQDLIPLDDAVEYDPFTNTFRQLPRMPAALYGSAAAAVDNKATGKKDVYVFGGYKQDGKEMNKDMFVFREGEGEDTWEFLFEEDDSVEGEVRTESGKAAREMLARALAAQAQVGNTLYAFGGVGKGSELLNDIIKVVFKDNGTVAVERLGVRLPEGLSFGQAAVLGVEPVSGIEPAGMQKVEILLFGGRTSRGETNDTYIFSDTVEASGPPDECVGGPEVTGVSIGGKMKIKGSGFIEGLTLSVNGVGFSKTPSVTNKKVVQKGSLTNGLKAAEICALGCELKVTNGDGKCTKVRAQ